MYVVYKKVLLNLNAINIILCFSPKEVRIERDTGLKIRANQITITGKHGACSEA
jgi:hypothetical protein